jgi:hypothetical protein
MLPSHPESPGLGGADLGPILTLERDRMHEAGPASGGTRIMGLEGIVSKRLAASSCCEIYQINRLGQRSCDQIATFAAMMLGKTKNEGN